MSLHNALRMALCESVKFKLPMLFLRNLPSFEFASVVRYKDTGELVIAWNNLGQNIPLKEFEEL